MATKIRLTRTGNKKRPFYRIVATNIQSRRDGRPLEFLGFYNPMTQPAQVSIDKEKFDKWVSLGADVSDTVRSLMKNK
ncbi:30S ribosomal protein S16 [Desulfovibrio cuneatus]|uniref:30S ribosomal protein S16 n=1 Tax=Desulfovibrio cuneatus TaxID=159728 RepID=UPI000415216E|nr:30S ribosomal protein S16 [Desulfovibrio cuneatus]